MGKEEDREFERFEETMNQISYSLDRDLFSLSSEELMSKWYWKWEEDKSMEWNTYNFNDMLEIYKHRCRKWEEYHNGTSCVVERVRDKYIMPRIKEFLIELNMRIYFI